MVYIKNFNGTLNGLNLSDINKKIDYSKLSLEDRKEVVNEILNTGFYDEYFEKYYKVNITSGDVLSENNNVCKSLEKLADYLLSADEVKKEKENQEYVFYTDENAFRKAIEREQKINDIGKGVEKENVIHFLKKEKRNHKKSKNQSITKNDLQRQDWLGEILRSYQIYFENVTNELKNYEDSKLSRFKLSQISGQIKNDMIISKDILLGTFGYKTNAEESTVIDWDFCDMKNPTHVKALLYMKPGYRNDEDLMFLIMDFVELIKKSKPTKLQKEIILLMRENKGPTEIGNELSISKQRVVKNINALVSRICKTSRKTN